MKNFNNLKTGAIVFIFALVLLFSNQIFAQKTTQIDDIAIKNIIKPNGKPLLINFWATWCEPCREEFPDLIKIHNDYKDKLDVVIISLDDLAEINRDVPKFLSEMKATMPSYLLKTTNEDAAISSVSKEWQGGLPFTILFNEKGETVYFKQGKFKTEVLRGAIDKILVSKVTQLSNLELPKPKIRSTEEGKTDAKNDIANGQLKIKRYGLTTAIPQDKLQELKEKYGIEIMENRCVLMNVTADYFIAYDEVMKSEISKRFGAEILKKVPL